MVIGVLLLAGTAGAVRVLASAVPVALVLAVGLVGGGLGGSYAVSGVARCDAGCPEVGDVSTAQQIHNLVGSLGYVLAIGGVVLFGVAARRTSGPGGRTLARASLIGAPVLVVVAGLVTALDDWRGLLQRVLEVLLFAWLLNSGRSGCLPGPGSQEPVELDPSGQVVDGADEAGERALGDHLQHLGRGQAGVEAAAEGRVVDLPPGDDDLPGQRVDGGGPESRGGVPARMASMSASSTPRLPSTVEWKATP